MATADTKLYASQENGFKSYVTVGEVAAVATGALPVPTASVRGGVLLGAAVANITPAADGTTAGTALNALLAQLRIAGIIAP